ncbi:molybdopterin converting factor subunit 1 [Alcanivorax sp. S71-1-4]|jgi:sulfur-carrier protein|uniref:molybdopterin converting factor subunit 1 n=1 Tax=Alcanivorax sp. S71-1-4 TaxID=1177159 RepID=UPI00135CB6BA|nr:molybdopterin converting factor subunit 1 [Alcanivorax sp. S71-1-4]KAF0810386.1 molybdopterin converting factor subunit 1 [Alcanivorax sp. S71-1-4]
MITVRFFAGVREALQTDALQLPHRPDLTVAALRTQLADRDPLWSAQLGSSRLLMCAVNEVMASPDTALNDGDVVAFFPPVTGG